MKPEWKDAPDWANYKAQDYSGAWAWYENEPECQNLFWSASFGAFLAVHQKSPTEPNPYWHNTLQKRPMSNDNEIITAHEAAIAWGNGEKLEYRTYPEALWQRFHGSAIILSEAYEYRRAQCTITVNGHEVPEPMREEPEHMSFYFVPDPKYLEHPWKGQWDMGLWGSVALLNNGLCHDNREAAIIHAKALADDDNA